MSSQTLVTVIAGALGVLFVILLLATLLERLVEAIISPFYDHIAVLTPYKWTQFIWAVIFGIIGALLYHFDLIYLAGQQFGADLPRLVYGEIITGAAIGSGSALIHDIITKFFPGSESK